jgi:hypothetical protein
MKPVKNLRTPNVAVSSLLVATAIIGQAALMAQPTLQITSPANGTVVSPGTTLTVSVTPSIAGAFANVFVIGFDPIGWVGMDVTTAPPWQLALRIPTRTSPGRYELTAGGAPTAGGEPIYSDPVAIQVERADNPVSISVDLANVFLSVGKRDYMLVWGVYSDGVKYNITRSTKTTFSSNDPSVATVDARGVITGIAPGKATVRVSNGPNASFFVSVTVSDPLKLVPRARMLYQGQHQQFYASAGYEPDPQVTWAIYPSEAGTIDSTGLYTAPANINSKQDVYVVADTIDGSAEASSRVTLYPNVAIAVAPASTTMLASQIKQFTATVTNAVDTAVDWSSSPDGVGSIDNAGVYTAPGSVSSPQAVTITATSAADPTKSASATLTVNPLPPPTLTSISPTSGAAGKSVRVTLTGTNFVPNTTVNANNSTIMVSDIVVVSTTQIIATFTISPDGEGISTPIVTTSAGSSSGGVSFTITTSNVPSILFLSPSSGHRGDTWLDVWVYGAWFTADMTVAVDNPGITIEYLDIYSGQVAYVGLTIASNAPLGPSNLRFTTGAGTSAPAVFAVNQ